MTNISNYRVSTPVCTVQQKNLEASLYKFFVPLVYTSQQFTHHLGKPNENALQCHFRQVA